MKLYINEEDIKGSSFIKISFQFEGSNLNFANITEKMKLEPILIRKEEDFPDVSKKSGVARDIWMLSSGYNESLLIADELNKFLIRISDKVDIINELKTLYNMKSILTISIQAYTKPYPLIPLKCIEFAYKTNTEIELDPYYYEDKT